MMADAGALSDSDYSEDDIDDDSDDEMSPEEICNMLESVYDSSGADTITFGRALQNINTLQSRFISHINDVFHHVVSRGNTKLIKSILQLYKNKGIDLEYDAHHDLLVGGGTPLITAARWGYPDTIRILLKHGSSVVAQTGSGETSLDLACGDGNLECTSLLVDHIQDPGSGLGPYEEELFYNGMVTAAYNGQDGILRFFISRGVDINLNLDDELGTALHRSIEGGNTQCTELLLGAGADVESLRRIVQQTPLMRAAEFGHVDVISRLLRKGAKIDRMTKECSSALNVACHYGHVNCVKYFLDNGANPHVTNPWGYTPLFMGADTTEIVHLLIKAGVSLDTKCGERGEAAIHLASVIGSVDTVKMLLDNGSHINIQTFHQETPLWLATWKGHVNVCRLLLQRNCSLNDPSNGCQVYAFDYMPVEIAMGLGHFTILKMILLAGGSICNDMYFGENDSGSMENVPWVKLRPEPLQMRQWHQKEFSWFYNFVKNPRSLKHICRIKARKLIGVPLNDKIRDLEIPLELKYYLCFAEL